MLASVRHAIGDIIDDYTPASARCSTRASAYLTTNMMEAVMNGGTARACAAWALLRRPPEKPAPSRTRGLPLHPSSLLCIVWVGNDDYTPLRSGNRGRIRARRWRAIWAAFMKKAILLPAVLDTMSSRRPMACQIITSRQDTNLLADGAVPTITPRFLVAPRHRNLRPQRLER